MKAINYFVGLFFAVLALGCQKEAIEFETAESFVRFHFLVDNDKFPLEFPFYEGDKPEIDVYTHLSTKTLKIPIAITGPLQNTPTDVYYSVETEGDYKDFSFNSPNKISIPAGKLVDTLRIQFNSNWSTPNTNKIKLKLNQVSNPSIRIGWANNHKKNDVFTIILGDLTTTRYNLESNLYEIQGLANEEFLIPIQFTNSVVAQQIANFNFLTASVAPLSLCENTLNPISYTLTREPFVNGSTVLYYKFKLISATLNPVNVKVILNNGLADFVRRGISQANIYKTENTVRQGDVAAQWYNISDNFHRNYGKSWYLDVTQNRCRWQTFQTFTKPVVVPRGSVFDNGNGYHKYRIGYKSPTNLGTNPFDFVRFYGGASNVSPAFTMTTALEFFPANGNSTTTGTVKVIPQTLVFIKLSNDQTVSVPICGSGNYYFDPANNRSVIFLEIRCDETQINGNNNVVKRMYIYNNDNSIANPADLTTDCATRIVL